MTNCNMRKKIINRKNLTKFFIYSSHFGSERGKTGFKSWCPDSSRSIAGSDLRSIAMLLIAQRFYTTVARVVARRKSTQVNVRKLFCLSGDQNREGCLASFKLIFLTIRERIARIYSSLSLFVVRYVHFVCANTISL